MNTHTEVSHRIAIIIPAYKEVFLKKTLDSLSLQTNKDFKVYIGDDSSPFDLLKIVEPYKNKLDITYKRYDSNKGGINLISHWERCLDMSDNEEWFIFFSDDDILEPNCIEMLNNKISITNSDVYHFNLKMIDSEDMLLKIPPEYPEQISSLQFYKLLFTKKIDARMPEFVFRTSHFKKLGGFVPFDLAIRTDSATVIKCGFDKGITTIDNAHVHWRNSGINLSSKSSSAAIHSRKLKSSVEFFNWITVFCREKQEPEPLSPRRKIESLLTEGLRGARYIGLKQAAKTLKKSNDIRANPVWSLILSLKAVIKVIFLFALRKIILKPKT